MADYEYTEELTGTVSDTDWIILSDEINKLDFSIAISTGEGYFEKTSAPKDMVRQDSPPGTILTVAASMWPNGSVTADSEDSYFGAMSAFRPVNVSGTCTFNVRGNRS